MERNCIINASRVGGTVAWFVYRGTAFLGDQHPGTVNSDVQLRGFLVQRDGRGAQAAVPVANIVGLSLASLALAQPAAADARRYRST